MVAKGWSWASPKSGGRSFFQDAGVQAIGPLAAALRSASVLERYPYVMLAFQAEALNMC